MTATSNFKSRPKSQAPWVITENNSLLQYY